LPDPVGFPRGFDQRHCRRDLQQPAIDLRLRSTGRLSGRPCCWARPAIEPCEGLELPEIHKRWTGSPLNYCCRYWTPTSENWPGAASDEQPIRSSERAYKPGGERLPTGSVVENAAKTRNKEECKVLSHGSYRFRVLGSGAFLKAMDGSASWISSQWKETHQFLSQDVNMSAGFLRGSRSAWHMIPASGWGW
jgi:hypothetical protein